MGGCSNCGGNDRQRCNLCNLAAPPFYPWGTDKSICYHCHNAHLDKIALYKWTIEREETLMKGKKFKKPKPKLIQ